MTYAITIDVAAPADLYDVFHKALIEHTGGYIDGLLTHTAWPTPTGFRIVEVWTFKEACALANETVIPQVWSTLAASTPDRPGTLPEQQVTELDVLGLVIPAAGIAL